MAKGSTLVEFALVLPMVLMLMFTTVDFGVYFFVQHTLQYATREGARLGLVGGTVNDGAGNPLSREASIVQRIRDRASAAMNPALVEVSIYPVAADFSDPVNWSGTLNAGSPGSYMRVRTTYSYTFITPFLGALVPAGVLKARAQATYRNELF
jgi:Flp pilus assembly protein TadG